MNNQTIIVTNDDFDYLEIIKELLHEEGYMHVFCAMSVEADGCIRHEQPDIILIDINTKNPAPNWLLLDRLRRDPATAQTPVVRCSIDSRIPTEKARIRREKHWRFLAKPFMIEELLSILQSVIGTPASR